MDSLINYSEDIESILEEIDVSDINYEKAKKVIAPLLNGFRERNLKLLVMIQISTYKVQ